MSGDKAYKHTVVISRQLASGFFVVRGVFQEPWASARRLVNHPGYAALRQVTYLSYR